MRTWLSVRVVDLARLISSGRFAWGDLRLVVGVESDPDHPHVQCVLDGAPVARDGFVLAVSLCPDVLAAGEGWPPVVPAERWLVPVAASVPIVGPVRPLPGD